MPVRCTCRARVGLKPVRSKFLPQCRVMPLLCGGGNSRDMPCERELELIEGAKAVQGYVLL